MSLDIRCAEKRRSSYEMDDSEDFQDTTRSTSPPRNSSKPMVAEDEKRIRREIANSNERRRMQSINAGFSSLKMLIPHQDNEKLSKAAILHQASDYITTLESEKNQLLTQNSFLRKRLKEIAPHEYSTISPPPKRKKRDTDSSDEGISMNFDDGSEELRKLLQREKQQREYFEEKTKRLEAQLVPERLHALASQVSREPMATDDMMDVDKKPDIVTMPPPPPAVAPVAHAPAAVPAMSTPRDIPSRKPVAEQAPAPAFTSPQSKRNLEILVEALCHLEGESCMNDMSESSPGFRSHTGSVDSRLESSNSDQEDSKSDSSGRYSPVPATDRISAPPHAGAGGMIHAPIATAAAPVGLESQTATLHVSSPQVIGTLPAAAALQMLHPQMYCPPGYYIQMTKS